MGDATILEASNKIDVTNSFKERTTPEPRGALNIQVVIWKHQAWGTQLLVCPQVWNSIFILRTLS
jgi:hypothetical protein